MTDEKKDNKGGKDAKKIDDEQLKDVAGGWKTDGTACPDVAPRAGGTPTSRRRTSITSRPVGLDDGDADD